MKKILTVVLASLMLAAGANAAFERVNTYSDDFSDVTEKNWFYLQNNGKLFIGRAGVAGEIHDLQVPSPDGNRMLPIETALNEEFLQSQKNGREYLYQTVRYTVQFLVNFLDPELIVLGGRLRDLGEDFMTEVSAEMALDPPRVLTFKLSQSGRIGAALGAALGIIIQNLTQFTKEVANES